MLQQSVYHKRLRNMAIAAEENPCDAYLYFKVGCEMHNVSCDQVEIGSRAWTAEQCFVHAIKCDPTFGLAYVALGTTLKEVDQRVVMPDGSSMDERGCYLAGIRLDPLDPYGYYNLAMTMDDDDTIMLDDGRVVTMLQCLVTAADRGIAHSDAYLHLGIAMGNRHYIMANGKRMSTGDCYAKAISLDARNPWAHYALGRVLGPLRTFRLLDGTVATARDCFMRAILCDPAMWDAYIDLGIITGNGESVVLLDGCEYTRHELFLAAIVGCSSASNAGTEAASRAYEELARTMTDMEAIELEGTTYTVGMCLQMAVQTNPSNRVAQVNLSRYRDRMAYRNRRLVV